jgi:ParB family chromosome partitioning protein
MQTLPLSKIQVDWNSNSRGDVGDVTSLMLSIKTQGLLQPVVVAKYNDELFLVAGFRRFRAYQMLAHSDDKYNEIPATIVPVANKNDAFVLNMIENLHRRPIGILAEAKAISNSTFGFEELMRQLGVSERWVLNRFALLKLPDYIQLMVDKGIIPEREIQALTRIKDSTLMREIAKRYEEAVDDNTKAPNLSGRLSKPKLADVREVRRKIKNRGARLAFEYMLGQITEEQFLAEVDKDDQAESI